MSVLVRLAVQGVRNASAATEFSSTLLLLARSSSQALHYCAGWPSTTAAAAPSSQAAAVTAQQQFWPRSASPFRPHVSLQQIHALSSNSSSSSSVRGFSSSAAAGSQCDCPTLGGPTPDIVTVEYDEDEVDRFIALADAIEEAFPNVVVEGNPAGPGRPGAFEVTGTNGTLLFSKLSSGSWPEAESVVDAMSMAASCGIQQQQ